MRDDFPRKVVEELEKRAGHVCSYPQCRMVTRGAVYGNGEDAKENVGQASHITAASPGGPRYDATITSDERKGIDNAIWMCYTHSKYIDCSGTSVSVEMLKEWKRQHEQDVKDGRIQANAVQMPSGPKFIRELSVEGMGVFARRMTIKFGRFNFLYGKNGSGKTTIAQLACWLAGKDIGECVARRFVRDNLGSKKVLEVTFGSERAPQTVKYVWERPNRRIKYSAAQSEVSQTIQIQSVLRAIPLEDGLFEYTPSKCGQPRMLASLAYALGIRKDELLSLIAKDGERVTAVGYKVRLSEDGRNLLYCISGSGRYQSFASLSDGEKLLALLDVGLRCVDIVPATQNWLMIVEHGMLETLYNRWGDKVVGILLALPVHIQLMACTTDEKVLNTMLSGHEEEFACDQIGKVAVWRSKKDYLKFG